MIYITLLLCCIIAITFYERGSCLSENNRLKRLIKEQNIQICQLQLDLANNHQPNGEEQILSDKKVTWVNTRNHHFQAIAFHQSNFNQQNFVMKSSQTMRQFLPSETVKSYKTSYFIDDNKLISVISFFSINPFPTKFVDAINQLCVEYGGRSSLGKSYA